VLLLVNVSAVQEPEVKAENAGNHAATLAFASVVCGSGDGHVVAERSVLNACCVSRVGVSGGKLVAPELEREFGFAAGILGVLHRVVCIGLGLE